VLLSEFIIVNKGLSRDGAEVIRIRLRYPSFDGNPTAERVSKFYHKNAQAYMRYAERLVPSAIKGSSVSMESEAWCGDGYVSVYYDIVEYEGTDHRPRLVNYRRVSQVWESEHGYIIPPKKLLQKCPDINLSKDVKKRYDGCYIKEGKLYIFINHYKKGAEEGKRRSQYRKFIEEKCIGKLSNC
jgi:hypothetical protein